jgi:hypothetical protein
MCDVGADPRPRAVQRSIHNTQSEDLTDAAGCDVVASICDIANIIEALGCWRRTSAARQRCRDCSGCGWHPRRSCRRGRCGNSFRCFGCHVWPWHIERLASSDLLTLDEGQQDIAEPHGYVVASQCASFSIVIAQCVGGFC